MSAEHTDRSLPTEPVDMHALIGDRAGEQVDRPHPRENPWEWHRRGLLAPHELDALVTARSNGIPTDITTHTPGGNDTPGSNYAPRGNTVTAADEPTYGDFLRETPA